MAYTDPPPAHGIFALLPPLIGCLLAYLAITCSAGTASSRTALSSPIPSPNTVDDVSQTAPLLDAYFTLYRYGELVFVDKQQTWNVSSLVNEARERFNDSSISSLRTRTGKVIGDLHSDLSREWQQRSFVVCLSATDQFVWPAGNVGDRVRVTLRPGASGGASERIVSVQTLSAAPRVLHVPDFLSAEECEHMVDIVRKNELVRSTVGDALEKAEERQVRTSSQLWIHPSEARNTPILDRVRARTFDLTRMHADIAEPLQFVHYGVGQHYYGHHDYSHKWESTENPYVQAGGNRFITVIFYLNDVEEGGETVFPFGNSTNKVILDENGKEKVWLIDENENYIYYGYGGCDDDGLRVPARKGSAVVFYNLLERHTWDAVPDSLSLHAGCDVTKGEKFMANQWIRNRRIDGKLFDATR